MVEWFYSISQSSLSPQTGHLGREIWRSMVNTRAIRHYLTSPFREMKKVWINRQPDVSSLRLIEFLSTYAPGWHGKDQKHWYQLHLTPSWVFWLALEWNCLTGCHYYFFWLCVLVCVCARMCVCVFYTTLQLDMDKSYHLMWTEAVRCAPFSWFSTHVLQRAHTAESPTNKYYCKNPS